MWTFKVYHSFKIQYRWFFSLIKIFIEVWLYNTEAYNVSGV